MEPHYAYVEALGVDDDAIRLGLDWVTRLASERLQSEAAIFVPALSSARDLSGALGQAVAGQLGRDRSARINGITFTLVTDRGHQSWSGPVLAVWADDRQVSRLERPASPGICVVPWNPEDISDYKARRRPLELRSQERAGGDDPVSNPVVAAALDSLTNLVNLSSGISHPLDKPKAVWTFKLLRDAGETFTPDEIRAGASHRGWRSDHAADLADVAQKVLDRRPVRGGKNPLRADAVERWRAEANGSA